MIRNGVLPTASGPRPHPCLITWLSRLQILNSVGSSALSVVLEPWDIQVWFTSRTKCTHFILGVTPQFETVSTCQAQHI